MGNVLKENFGVERRTSNKVSTYKWNDNAWRSGRLNKGVLSAFEHEGHVVKVRHDPKGYRVQVYAPDFKAGDMLCSGGFPLGVAKKMAEDFYKKYRKDNE